MKLYYTKGACSLAVRILINELGLTADYETVNLKTKKTEKDADFLEINKKGSVPVIVTDDNKVLTENAVILQYLADTNNAVELLPTVGNFQRYRVLEWLNYITTELHKGFGPLFNADMPADVKDKIFIPLLQKKFDFLNQHLQNNKYLLGDQFTLPDIYLFVILTWAHHFKIDVGSQLTKYFTELTNRPAIQKSLQEEGLK